MLKRHEGGHGIYRHMEAVVKSRVFTSRNIAVADYGACKEVPCSGKGDAIENSDDGPVKTVGHVKTGTNRHESRRLVAYSCIVGGVDMFGFLGGSCF